MKPRLRFSPHARMWLCSCAEHVAMAETMDEAYWRWHTWMYPDATLERVALAPGLLARIERISRVYFPGHFKLL